MGEEIYYRNWITWLWRLRRAIVCHLQIGQSRNVLNSLSPKARRIRSSDVWWQEEMDVSAQERESALSSLFCSIEAPNRLDDAPPHWIILTCLMNQMIISSRNTLSHTSPEIMFCHLSGHPWGQSSRHINLILTLRMPSSLRTKLQPGSITCVCFLKQGSTSACWCWLHCIPLLIVPILPWFRQ